MWTLDELSQGGEFVRRHIGPTDADRERMLSTLGRKSVEDLLTAAIPAAIRTSKPLDLPQAASEAAVLEELEGIASDNVVFTSLIGLGYNACHTPPVIQRNILESPAWYTAYTPYQAEISQGRLEALLNFQTAITDLTGMEIANSSLLDEGSAVAEAVGLCRRVSSSASERVLLDADCHPHIVDVVSTRAAALGIEVGSWSPDEALPDGGAFAVMIQYPGSSGELGELASAIESAKQAGAMVIVSADPLALALVESPGALGADVVVGTSQRFGVPLWFGGPHAAYMATRQEYSRQLPGRIVGVSADAHGRPALRLALQTREQHIRRERATSNICTAQVLLAVVAGAYAAYHGPDGLRSIAERVHGLTATLAKGLADAGLNVLTQNFFDTITVSVPGRAAEVVGEAAARRINLRLVDADRVGISLDETTTPDVVEAVWAAFGVSAEVAGVAPTAPRRIPTSLERRTPYLKEQVFNRYHSETAMLRYLRSLSDKDIALDRGMIPLGSCTMKLNGTAELAAITWPGFARLHPFVPLDQAAGYLRMVGELEKWLAEVSGFDAVSVQPNAGSQGELAGLLVIRKYHAERGESHRNVCLIPSSAHGTNAASAALAGMKVAVVACDSEGSVDLDDLRTKIARHEGSIAALMITYPSTHGVYEQNIMEICQAVHDAGGQVYLDGANLNALVGLVRPGEIGADVAHFNLHKTFCIPHGGGGPGVGPIGVARHLAAYLPSSSLVPQAGPESGIGAVASSPWGSAGVLAISWAYMRLMGPDGLRDATAGAVLAANYLAERLSEHFPVLYSGNEGTVAHECILDVRELSARSGVTAEDIAKRLMDYGFHAPTMSWPVAGTLMVEPTESEPLVELDRFCDAMASIRREMDVIADGTVAVHDSPLRNAPHTAEVVSAPDWDRPYSRSEAAFPAQASGIPKYWPPVGRIDNALGDRNLVCTCAPLESYEESGA